MHQTVGCQTRCRQISAVTEAYDAVPILQELGTRARKMGGPPDDREAGRSYGSTHIESTSHEGPGMFTTTVKRIVVTATVVLVTAAAPSAASADFSVQKPVDKTTPTTYQNSVGTSGTTTAPAK